MSSLVVRGIGQNALAWHSRFLATWPLPIIFNFVTDSHILPGSLPAIQGSHLLLEPLTLAFFTSTVLLILFLQRGMSLSLISPHQNPIVSQPRYHNILHGAFPHCPAQIASSSSLPHMASHCYNMYLLLLNSFFLELAHLHSPVLNTEWLSNAAGWMKGWTEQAISATASTPLHMRPMAAGHPFDHQP